MEPLLFHQFVYYFHTKRDYFECHEFMEEAWKNKPTFTKSDIEVAFILFATSEYHYRRNNIIGAQRCLKKSIQLFETHANTLTQLEILDTFIHELNDRLANMTYNTYIPFEIPISTACEFKIKKQYPDYAIQKNPITENIINKHIYEYLMRDKNPVNNAPD